MSRKRILSLVVTLAVFSGLSRADAHFPWLATNDDGKPVLFFGEGLTDRTYHLPKQLADFPIAYVSKDSAPKPLETKSIESESFVGLSIASDALAAGCVYGSDVYGVYHGSKLTYFVQHFVGSNPEQWTAPPSDLALRADASVSEGNARVQVWWNNEPLSNNDVKLLDARGEVTATKKTNEEGIVEFDAAEIKDGLNALMVGVTNKDDSGSIADQTYTASMNYLTATFQLTQATEPAPSSPNKSENSVTVVSTDYPELPLELTSFGGAIVDDQLFVYGGHSGNAHSYSTEEQSDVLWSLDLANPKKWVELSRGPKLQGLALVPAEGAVVRLGGFTAKNAPGSDHDLHSQATVAKFDLSKKAWTDLTPLPEARSSHAAAILDNKIYVVGGWSMSGEDNTVWHQTAWVGDLKEANVDWKPLAHVPFQRRALAVAAHAGKIYAIGGMDKEGGVSTRVDIYDPQTDQWHQGPALVGDRMTGFGCFAESSAGSLYVSTVTGNIQRLSDDGKQWTIVGTYDPGRFFHCMLSTGKKSMLMVGGANMSVGRFTDILAVKVQ